MGVLTFATEVIFFHPLHGIQIAILFTFSEEVILAEERTTEEERNHIMEARRRAANKRRKLKLTSGIGKNRSRSTETDEEDDEPDEGNYGRSHPTYI